MSGRIYLLALLVCWPMLASAATGESASWIAQMVSQFASSVDAVVFAYIPGTPVRWIVLWLVIAAFVTTYYFRFVQFRQFGLALQIVRGRYSQPHHAGEVTHFQALSTAVSGTVGLGNIAGVAVAITIGGAGATIWMILLGFLSMATKFAECTLGVKYRTVHADGSVSGGPMYYLSKGLAERGLAQLGKVLAVVIAFFVILGAFGAGNLFQANQATAQIVSYFNWADASLLGASAAFWLGLLFAAIVAVVIIGGIKSIAAVTSRLVPFMAILYVLAALVVLAVNAGQIPAALVTIVQSAFSLEAGLGGLVGAMMAGFQRAAFSNEAGFGSAPIAHAAVKTDEPTTEGLVALLEPFIDTVIICTMTALVIVVTGAHLLPDLNGIEITSAAFATVSSGFTVFLTIAVVLFAFSTMLSWSYYGLKGWTYLFGQRSAVIFKLLFCSMCVVGAVSNLTAILTLSDAAVFLMALVNIFGLYLLLPVVRAEVNGFLTKLKTGEIKPNP